MSSNKFTPEKEGFFTAVVVLVVVLSRRHYCCCCFAFQLISRYNLIMTWHTIYYRSDVVQFLVSLQQLLTIEG